MACVTRKQCLRTSAVLLLTSVALTACTTAPSSAPATTLRCKSVPFGPARRLDTYPSKYSLLADQGQVMMRVRCIKMGQEVSTIEEGDLTSDQTQSCRR